VPESADRRRSWKRWRRIRLRQDEDLHAALGYGKFSRARCCRSWRPIRCRRRARAGARRPEPAAPAQPAAPGDKDLVIKVKGIDDLLVYRAKCCNPIRGEAIVGYVTRGKGIAVHSLNAPTSRT
jgi:GTP diphosphokinase / guanosine-3',5'-bis(diphosphate) 3'-diphosphatase